MPVTTFQADVEVSTSSHTGDTVSRAELALRFQPESARSGKDYTDAVFLKIMLKDSAAGLLAQSYCFECTSSDCSTTSNVGKQTAGTWVVNGNSASGVSIAQEAYYNALISWDPTAKIVTFTLARGTSTIASGTIDLQQGDSTSPACRTCSALIDEATRCNAVSQPTGS